MTRAAGPVIRADPRAVFALVHALVDDVAVEHGLRYVVVKGVGAQHFGLQDVRASADVDILLTAREAAVMADALVSRGWVRRPADADAWAFPRHSTSFFHPSWSCDIDVHHRFPGAEGEPDRTFEHIWKHRTEVDFAGRVVPCPDRATATVLVALHALRSPWVARHASELQHLIAMPDLPPEREVLAAVDAIGARACVEPFLALAYGTAADPSVRPSAEWRLRTSMPSPMARRVALFRAASFVQKLRFVRIALFPPPETLAKMDALHAPHGIGLWLAYGRRWRRGLRALVFAFGEGRGGRSAVPGAIAESGTTPRR